MHIGHHFIWILLKATPCGASETAEYITHVNNNNNNNGDLGLFTLIYMLTEKFLKYSFWLKTRAFEPWDQMLVNKR